MTIPENPATNQTMTPTMTPTKLHGRTFYESIGSPKRIVAPMVEASELAWRILSRKHNADAAYSPMLHAKLFSETKAYRASSLTDSSLKSSSYDGDKSTDRPLFIQFCANDPEYLLSSAKLVQDRCDAIDLNLGCPQGIARKGNYGAFLQESPETIYNLINRLHKELSIPVTAKIRVQETKEKTLEYARMILDAGASILTVHGRRRDQKGHATGLADWSFIRYLRENLPKDTVIFANGNILYNTDIDDCLEATGADGIMSAEANLYNPAIFVDPSAPFEERFPRVDHVCRMYVNIVKDLAFGVGNEIVPMSQEQAKQNPSLMSFKSHMFRLLHAFFTVEEHKTLRPILGKASGRNFQSYLAVVEEVERTVEAYLEKNPERPEDWERILADGGGVGADVILLEIPWWRCQPFVRPSVEQAFEKGALKEKKDKVKDGKRMADDEGSALKPEAKKSKVAVEEVEFEANNQACELDTKVAG